MSVFCMVAIGNHEITMISIYGWIQVCRGPNMSLGQKLWGRGDNYKNQLLGFMSEHYWFLMKIFFLGVFYFGVFGVHKLIMDPELWFINRNPEVFSTFNLCFHICAT